MIYGTAYDESLGDQLRVTVIATGLSSVRRSAGCPDVAPLKVVAQPAMQGLRTGTDNLAVLNTVAQPATAMATGQGLTHTSAAPAHDYTGRGQAAAKVDALASNGMDEIEIPALVRQQAD